jgi:hypothetical protein
VLFDQSAVGSGPETPWVTVQGMISDSHSPYYSAVAWSVGYYTVEGGKKIYGLICVGVLNGGGRGVLAGCQRGSGRGLAEGDEIAVSDRREYLEVSLARCQVGHDRLRRPEVGRHSHGGCITYRAVEQGAPVTAFSVIEEASPTSDSPI